MFFFQAEDGIRDVAVTGVQTCALPISEGSRPTASVAFCDFREWLRKRWDAIPPRREVRARVESWRKGHSRSRSRGRAGHRYEIGRASCRERVWMSGREVCSKSQ